MKKRISQDAMLSIALLMLFNPNINLLDILPDCIAYVIIIYVIKSSVDTVPYAAECVSALGKLALVSAVRIPSFFVMYNNLGTGRDIVPMFTLIFVALELILLYSAIENGHKALSYVGERTEASVAVSPFVINKKGGVMTPFTLKILTMIFFLARGILNLIPELMLLTSEDTSLRKKLSDAYPTVLVLCIFAALIAGVIWHVYAKKYLKALCATDDIRVAVDNLRTKEAPEVEKKNAKLKAILDALIILAVSSIFSIDLTFSDFGDKNILPHFIYAIILFYAIFRLTSKKKPRIFLSVCTAAFTLSNIASNYFASNFFEKYEYLHLLYSSGARRLYLPVKISAVAEAVFAIALLTVSALAFAEFIKENTGVTPSDEAYGKMSKRTHRSLTVKGCILFGISGLINILKCVNVFLKGSVSLTFTEINDEGFATGALPWMSTLIFGLCIVFVIYSFYFISEVKNEVKFKYMT